MKPNSESTLKSKWMPAMIVLVGVSMMTALVEPAAFARDGHEAPNSEQPAAERAVAVPLPKRPVIVATVAVALPQQPQTRTLATPPTGAAKATAKQETIGKSRKWIYIVAAAGAGATAAFLLRGNGEPPPPAPTITVGSPTVGGPQ